MPCTVYRNFQRRPIWTHPGEAAAHGNKALLAMLFESSTVLLPHNVPAQNTYLPVHFINSIFLSHRGSDVLGRIKAQSTAGPV